MYIHLGSDVVVGDKSIIGVFDLDNTTQSVITRKYLESAQRGGKVVNVGQELPKSFVVAGERGNSRVYVTVIATNTLAKRCSRKINTRRLIKAGQTEE